jgi:hypothetical protein
MPRRYIDFISAYCDSWCERCAFTQRCSHFAVQSALGMCDGDVERAMELAIGPPRVPGKAPPKKLLERMAEVLGDQEPSAQELERVGREIAERRDRIRRVRVAEASMDYAVAARRWFGEHKGIEDHPDPAVREAIETIGRDAYLIHIKIMRALDGRDENPDGMWFEKSAVQSDWNGSAKVALLSIQRSEPAWRAVATAIRDEAGSVLAGCLAALHEEMNREFPRAMEFRRPGFDDRSVPS